MPEEVRLIWHVSLDAFGPPRRCGRGRFDCTPGRHLLAFADDLTYARNNDPTTRTGDPSMRRLTNESDWDPHYVATNRAAAESRGRLPERFFGSYADSQFWSLIGKHLPPRQRGSVLEIGCAPGRTLRGFALRFGCVPSGVDFSEQGVSRTRENFEQWGYPPENVVRADVFDAAFQASVNGRFDVVVSGGFIEHFTGLRPVIDAHLGPLRPGGLLVITIPNYQGLNYALGTLTVGQDYPLHNFDIMKLKHFRSIFVLPHLQTLECRYFGGFDIGIFDTGASTLLLKSFRRAQVLLNLGFRMIPPPSLPWVSPFLIFIGRKVPT
jgi:SAM-dependent methyltransferase